MGKVVKTISAVPSIGLILFIFLNFYFFWCQARLTVNELPVFIIFLLVLVSYLQCIVTHPGKVPNNFDFIEESSKSRLDHSAYISDLRPAFASFCERCLRGRPARSHHCSSCGECILKRDHHCIWINNCVGLLNHKHFIHLIGYGALTTSLISCRLYESLIDTYEEASNFEFAGFFLNIGTCVTLTFMTIYHLWLIVNNKTMINFRINNKKNIFDIDLSTNLSIQLGTNKLSWILPITPKLPILNFPVKLQKSDNSSEIISNKILLPNKD